MLLELFSGRLLKAPTDAVVTKWFRGSDFGQLVVTNTQTLCEDALKSDGEVIKDMTGDGRWALLKVALATYKDQGGWDRLRNDRQSVPRMSVILLVILNDII